VVAFKVLTHLEGHHCIEDRLYEDRFTVEN